MLLKLLLRSRRVHPDVDLSVRNINAEVGEHAERAGEDVLLGGRDVLGGGGLGDHVALEADAVDAVAVGLDELGSVSTLSLQTLGRGRARERG